MARSGLANEIRKMIAPQEEGKESGSSDSKEAMLKEYEALGSADDIRSRVQLLDRMAGDPALRPYLDDYLSGNSRALEHLKQYSREKSSGGGVTRESRENLASMADDLADLVRREVREASSETNARLWSSEMRDSFRELQEDPVLGSIYDPKRDKTAVEEKMRRTGLSASEAFAVVGQRRIQEAIAATSKDLATGSTPGSGGKTPERTSSQMKRVAEARKRWRESGDDELALRELIIEHAGGEEKIVQDLTSVG